MKGSTNTQVIIVFVNWRRKMNYRHLNLEERIRLLHPYLDDEEENIYTELDETPIRRRRKMIPYKCPTCLGHGTVSMLPWIAGDQPTWIDNGTSTYPCPSCKGIGVLWGEGGKDDYMAR